MISNGQGQERGLVAHKDSFGFLRTALTGVTTWNDRAIRTTGGVVPHIAKADVFTYNIQLNHDKQQGAPCDGFHIHAMPVSLPVAENVIAIDFTWGIYHEGDVIPDTLPNTGTFTSAAMAAADQFKHKRYAVIGSMAMPGTETYSSFVLIKCTRRNDGQDTYAGELALLGADVHYTVDRYGSKNEGNDV